MRRVDQLEEKLYGLVSLLKPPQQVLENSGGNTIVAQSQFQPLVQQFPHTPSSGPSLSISPGQEAQESKNAGDNVSPDALLYIYRNNMATQFPFPIIPDRVSAAELAQTKTFLYKTVLMAASYHEKTGQPRMTKEVFQYLSAHMIIANEKSLDSLQCLLVLMAWSVQSSLTSSLRDTNSFSARYQFHINVARRLTLMLQLAGGLIIDLGFSQTSSARVAEQTTELSLGTYVEDIPIPKELTLDERRAMLGLNFISSVCVFDCGPLRG
jgi:hypothetical protein